MDNATAVAHINSKGGTFSPQLVSLTLELWQWCLQKSILQGKADLVLVAPVWQAQPEPVNQESCHDPKLQTPAEGFCIPSENPSNVPQASFSRLSVFREQY